MKALMIGYKKDNDLIIKVNKHLKKVSGVGWKLIERLPNGKGKIVWFKDGSTKGRKTFIKVL